MLKSPLFGLDDDDLFKLAWRAQGIAARGAAREGAADRASRPRAKLDRLARWARSDTPFAFYAGCSAPESGRASFLARLGHEADDALDEFLNLALDYETPRDAVAAGLRRLAAHAPRPT